VGEVGGSFLPPLIQRPVNVSKRLSVSTLPRPVFALHGHVESHKGCVVFGFEPNEDLFVVRMFLQ
jgi:hypothetical protein